MVLGVSLLTVCHHEKSRCSQEDPKVSQARTVLLCLPCQNQQPLREASAFRASPSDQGLLHPHTEHRASIRQSIKYKMHAHPTPLVPHRSEENPLAAEQLRNQDSTSASLTTKSFSQTGSLKPQFPLSAEGRMGLNL